MRASTKKTFPLTCRAMSAKVVADVVGRKASLSTLLPLAMEQTVKKDQGLLQEMCYGSLRHFFSLRASIEKHLSKPLKAKDQDVLMLLVVGAYQLKFMRIPDYAAIDSTVAAAMELKKEWAKGLVNAVLRKIQKDIKQNPEATNTPLTGSDEAHYDHPQWLIDKIRFAWPLQAISILEANNTKAPLTLRVNSQKTDRDSYMALLKTHSINGFKTILSDTGIQLEMAIDVEKLPFFAEGFASVQDEAAQLTTSLLRLADKHVVLDACAAPGGKTCHMLETLPGLHVVAVDIDESRTALIKENLHRLGLSASVIVGDATQPASWYKESCQGKLFDRILLDAPCSASGVIRHHPDIKLLRQPEDVAGLAKIQLQLLCALWPLLKPGGIMLYTTCSILPEENEGVVSEFLKNTTDAGIDAINESWGITTAHGRQLFPQKNGHDGFYFSRIKKFF